MLSEDTLQSIETLLRRYPQPRSALIPALQLAQDEAGCISPEIIREVAKIFQLSPNEVYEVASFYTMLFKEAGGQVRHPGLHQHLVSALRL